VLTSLQWYIVTMSLAGVLGLIAVVAPRKRMIKYAALACTASFLPLSYFAISDLLSRPKPLQIVDATERLQNAIVTASIMRENEAIYLWLQMPGIGEPRSYQLPWSEEMAIELHEATREAEDEGGDVQMNLPEGNASDSEEPMFQATTYEPPPPKDT